MKSRLTAVVGLVLLFVAGLVVASLVSDPASAQTTTSVETGAEGTTTGATQAETLSSAFWYIFALAALVAVVWTIPFILDIWLAYKSQGKRLDLLIHQRPAIAEAAAEDKGLTLAELRELNRAADVAYSGPIGVSGLSRALFAFAVLATISTVLFALVALGRSGDAEIVKSIVAALVGAFTTIVGVYFGARTSESATQVAAENVRRSGGLLDGDDGSAEGDIDVLKPANSPKPPKSPKSAASDQPET